MNTMMQDYVASDVMNGQLSPYVSLWCRLQRSDGQGVSPGIAAVPHDTITTGQMSRWKQDPCDPVTKKQKSRCNGLVF